MTTSTLKNSKLPQILHYQDYRSFIKDWLSAKQQYNSKYSLRWLAEKMELNAGFLSRILKSERRLSLKNSKLLFDVFGLKKKETEYFELLMLQNDANSLNESKKYYEQIMLQKSGESRALGLNQYQYFDQWHHTVLREILTLMYFRGNYERLATKFIESINLADLRTSLHLLLDLGMIKKTAKGFTSNKEWIGAKGGIHPVIVRSHQIQMIELGIKALTHMSPSHRDMSTLTVALPENKLEYAREKLKELRQHFVEIANQQSTEKRKVYQLNLQLFPLTNEIDPEEKI